MVTREDVEKANDAADAAWDRYHKLREEYRMIEYTVRVYDNGDKWWYLNGKRHREDGPAIERASGGKAFYLNGKVHREGGPAVEWADGEKEWYLDNRKHREDGPAIERADGSKRWFLNGEQLTETEFKNRMNKPCSGKVVEVEGVKYKLVEVV